MAIGAHFLLHLLTTLWRHTQFAVERDLLSQPFPIGLFVWGFVEANAEPNLDDVEVSSVKINVVDGSPVVALEGVAKEKHRSCKLLARTSIGQVIHRPVGQGAVDAEGFASLTYDAKGQLLASLGIQRKAEGIEKWVV